MKKLLVVLLALSVFGVLAFADEAAPALAFSGSLYSGLQLNGSATATTLKLYDQTNGDPEDIWLDGALSGKAAGLKFEFYTSDGTNAKVDVLYGWWKPFDMLTVSGGEGVGDIYTTPNEGWDASSGSGFQLALVPIEGLQIGVWIPATLTAVNLGTNVAGTLSYDMAKLFKAGLGFSLVDNFLWAGFNLAAVENLTTQVDFEYYINANGNGATTAAGTYRGELNLAYAIAGAKPGVWVYYSTKTGDPAWGVKPSVSYVIDAFTPAAYFQYNADSTWSTGVNLAIAVEKQTAYFYVDYQSAATWDVGVNFKMAF